MKDPRSIALEERTAQLGERVVMLCKKAERNVVSIPIIKQLVRSAHSIGANYAEANNASSRKDFRNKIYIVKKECQETKYTIRLLAAAEPHLCAELRLLWQECHEFTKIFQAIATSLDSK
ncbi:four helix bundle protein [Candidatus Peregrinibacteria bacterium]|nr:four helix bundle protein [Candidatus Peregrinibacteria bacterium]